jgi:hypothetical protein
MLDRKTMRNVFVRLSTLDGMPYNRLDKKKNFFSFVGKVESEMMESEREKVALFLCKIEHRRQTIKARCLDIGT